MQTHICERKQKHLECFHISAKLSHSYNELVTVTKIPHGSKRCHPIWYTMEIPHTIATGRSLHFILSGMFYLQPKKLSESFRL